jgi:hypothetical protein
VEKLLNTENGGQGIKTYNCNQGMKNERQEYVTTIDIAENEAEIMNDALLLCPGITVISVTSTRTKTSTKGKKYRLRSTRTFNLFVLGQIFAEKRIYKQKSI